MQIAAHRGSRIHAPENSLPALISAYTGGADVLEFDLQMTADNELVLSHDITLDRLTGEDGRIDQLTLRQLRHTSGQYDFSARFNPSDVDSFRYFKPGRRLLIEAFDLLIDELPEDAQFLIELKHDSASSEQRRTLFAQKTLHAIENRDLTARCVLYSKDLEIITSLRSLSNSIRLAVFDWELEPDDQIALIEAVGADGLVTALDDVVEQGGTLTEFGAKLETACTRGALRVGAILYPYREPGVFGPEELEYLSTFSWVWSVSTDSILAVLPDPESEESARDASSGPARRKWLWIDEDFAGEEVNRDLWSLGYAKAHDRDEDNAHVFQRDGIHIHTSEYTGWEPGSPSSDPIKSRLDALEYRMLFAEKSWPFYTGGGVGLNPGIVGDFVAEVDYWVERPMTQAATLEMAVLNVDPGSHRSQRPQSFRDADAFYDPHGAPPYVGVEHDEDDGFRINWNLGSRYDANQYGPPVGDGKTPQRGTLRLERRGAYFSAHYRNHHDAPNWICVGSVRNRSLNDTVFLRCVAKRWRQERADDPTQFWPIPENTFSFGRLRIWRWSTNHLLAGNHKGQDND